MIDCRLVAVATAFAQCPPGRQLLRAHPLALIQVVYAALLTAFVAWIVFRTVLLAVREQLIPAWPPVR